MWAAPDISPEPCQHAVAVSIPRHAGRLPKSDPRKAKGSTREEPKKANGTPQGFKEPQMLFKEI